MNTAQVSIELVLAGILAMCAFVLPFFPSVDLNAELLQSEALIGVLGLSYLLGVVFDKLADTMLHAMEHLQRLQQADEYLNTHPQYKGKDAFPQNKLEFNLRKSKDGRLDWMNALKSRIRTSRELAVLGLPAALGIVIHQYAAPRWALITVGLNLFLFIAAAWLESNTVEDATGPLRSRAVRIKTHDLAGKVEKRREQMERAGMQARKASAPYYLSVGLSLLTMAAVAAVNAQVLPIGLIGAGALILSMLGLWTNLRITRTYIRFVAREMPGYLKEKERMKKAGES